MITYNVLVSGRYREIRKTQSLQECSTSFKWAIVKLGPNKPPLMALVMKNLPANAEDARMRV